MLADKTFLSKLGATPSEVLSRLHQEIQHFQESALNKQDHWFEPRETEAWTPAQITEHVILVSKVMSRVLTAYQLPEFPDFPKTPGTYQNGKMQSPSYAQPSEGKPWENLEPEWIKTHIRLVQTAEKVPNWQDERTVFHPFFGEMNALEWLQLATYHLIHHRRQLNAGPA
ncbi:DinB family protein [Deinococcus roseus]|uniref:DinB-like domain-containing protein n=1 Tax=Deinococcus roseus TaxID=392414 RepID=A0ABQ2CV99_9DEIO|nr:DinB family protein [Deinococcus roseus]GGJ24124.1 hypothetical protein GCM10008938_07830 [Deinococcus roseus]